MLEIPAEAPLVRFGARGERVTGLSYPHHLFNRFPAYTWVSRAGDNRNVADSRTIFNYLCERLAEWGHCVRSAQFSLDGSWMAGR